MRSLSTLLLKTFSLYPLSGAEDYYKLIYQSCFGPQHLNQDPIMLKNYFFDEWDLHQQEIYQKQIFENITLITPISRFHFAPAKQKNIHPEIVFSAFLRTIQTFQPVSINQFHRFLEKSRELLQKPPYDQPIEKIDQIWEYGLTNRPSLPHHSIEFNQAYQTHYRLIIPSLLIL